MSSGAATDGSTPFEPNTAKEKQELIKAAADKILSLRGKTTEQPLEIGRQLIAAKKAMEHGTFTPWLRFNFKWSKRTAQNYISAAKFSDDKSETVSHLQETTVY